MEGVIKKWFPEKGFGFVRLEDGREIFLHISNFGGMRPQWGQKEVPQEGMPLKDIEVGKGKNGKPAITLCRSEALAADIEKRRQARASEVARERGLEEVREFLKQEYPNLEVGNFGTDLQGGLIVPTGAKVFNRRPFAHLGELFGAYEDPNLQTAKERLPSLLETSSMLKELQVELDASRFAGRVEIRLGPWGYRVKPQRPNSMMRAHDIELGRENPLAELRKFLFEELPQREPVLEDARKRLGQCPQLEVLPVESLGHIEVKDLEEFPSDIKTVQYEEIAQFLTESEKRAGEIREEVEN